MNLNLLEQFLVEECTPYVRRLLLSALEAARDGSGPPKKQFEFNRFDVTLDLPGDVVLLEDVLDSAESGAHTVPLHEFYAVLERLG